MQASNQFIKICAHHSISSLGIGEKALHYYRYEDTFIKRIQANDKEYWAAPIDEYAEIIVERFKRDFPKYNALDRSTILALICAKFIGEKLNLSDKKVMVNAASSRGATSIWENAHEQFLNGENISIKTSPFTTLGNISNYVTQFLKLQSASPIDTSVTCSSGLQALANGIAWLKSNLTEYAFILATEAPLTGFTFKQMEALGIYSDLKSKYPCKPFSMHDSKKNSMVLGEAAVGFLLKNTDQLQTGDFYIDGIGFGNEIISSPTSISSDGKAFQQAMYQAVANSHTQEFPDVIIAHAPGTHFGDEAEKTAIKTVFQENTPAITSNKWKIGHTFAASGLMSMEMALYILGTQFVPIIPYPSSVKSDPKKIERVMVNTMGFGGNATSVMIAIKK